MSNAHIHPALASALWFAPPPSLSCYLVRIKRGQLIVNSFECMASSSFQAIDQHSHLLGEGEKMEVMLKEVS
jgi:hypothetical protein